MKFICYHD